MPAHRLSLVQPHQLPAGCRSQHSDGTGNLPVWPGSDLAEIPEPNPQVTRVTHGTAKRNPCRCTRQFRDALEPPAGPSSGTEPGSGPRIDSCRGSKNGQTRQNSARSPPYNLVTSADRHHKLPAARYRSRPESPFWRIAPRHRHHQRCRPLRRTRRDLLPHLHHPLKHPPATAAGLF